MHLPRTLVEAFPPSNLRLIDLTRAEIDDDMLTEIAKADYGCASDEHLAVIRPIRDTGIVPALGWHGGEVLELIRWSNPENPHHKPGATGFRGHRIRAFSCAVLLRSAFDHNSDGSDEATLALCLGSTRVLGRDFDDAAASFLTWALPKMSDWSAYPFEPQHTEPFLFALGLLVLTTRFSTGRLPASAVADAAELVLREDEKLHRGQRGLSDHPPAAFGVSNGYWSPLAAELAENARALPDNATRDSLLLLGEVLKHEL